MRLDFASATYEVTRLIIGRASRSILDISHVRVANSGDKISYLPICRSRGATNLAAIVALQRESDRDVRGKVSERQSGSSHLNLSAERSLR